MTTTATSQTAETPRRKARRMTDDQLDPLQQDAEALLALPDGAAAEEPLRDLPSQQIDLDDDHDDEVDEQLNLSPASRAFIASVSHHLRESPNDRAGVRELLNQHLVSLGMGSLTHPKNLPADPGADHHERTTHS